MRGGFRSARRQTQRPASASSLSGSHVLPSRAVMPNASARMQMSPASVCRWCVLCAYRLFSSTTNKRQLPLRGDVQGLVDDPFAQGAVANEHHGDAAGSCQLLGQREACRHGHDSSLDAVAEKALPAQVLAASATAANARPLAHNLGDQPIDIVGSCQEMSVTAVIAEHEIRRLQVLGDGNARPLLANARMDGPEQLALREQMEQALLDGADQNRLGVERFEPCGRRNAVGDRRVILSEFHHAAFAPAKDVYVAEPRPVDRRPSSPVPASRSRDACRASAKSGATVLISFAGTPHTTL